ncbi:aminotransferase class V-fold PLP-dependent enzyme [Spiroplasma platyhelix]|uniref:Aminotransferase class V-fold PLP-dependent enzyme n=1 Tax=Spiroplasma platyhelix PALS-1 TaxID=1276218 RepID=A0A846TW81_9MOLU|nr:aminotransferase class V-fold PLP-dependent enzyme [Spiroplasma platyhelix]MBE4704052.1 Cysteine desulfurase SufS [Spiroplasma platyhelix PALS-1]NKE38422.1 aminotransferase class V-fold PLP-dependent enzyme [Spiroplasma platyhelix PALS-1]UJB29310.1 cysteine desulfurase [Spiroplasma platyhelix PALS-1]
MNNNKTFSDIKSEFPFFKKNRNLVFFDSAATSLKPKVVIDAVNKYYQNYSTNTHNLDFPLAIETKDIYESCRQDVADFIHSQKNEVIFCPSTTFALNQIAYSLGQYLKEGDEVVLTTCEHSSLLLPFYRLAQEKKIILKFIDVSTDGLITITNLKKILTKKTRIVAFASMNNSLGTINNVRELAKIVKNFKIEKKSQADWPFEKVLVLIDGAQSISHSMTNVSQWDIDFFTFSAHKLFGPTGIAVWWAKAKWLDLMQPLILGGGMNGRIYKDGKFTLLDPPDRFEAGTPNLAGIFGLQAAIKYVREIGIENIAQYERELKKYALEQFKKHLGDKVVVYNENQESGILLFNVLNVAAEDVANYLGHQKIALRSGNFCAKLLSEVINCASSLRVSFSIYNNKQDVDHLIAALQKGFNDGGDFLNEFFN